MIFTGISGEYPFVKYQILGDQIGNNKRFHIKDEP